jgi:hypothetical protein
MTPLITRRDRAACVLALICARSSAEDARDALGHGGAIASAILAARHPVPLGWTDDIHTAECAAWLREWRIYRARLALYLRALLRADAGDCGPWTFKIVPTRSVLHADRRVRDHRRIRPLWEQAPPCR